MTSQVAPLAWNVPIVDPDTGFPSPEFQHLILQWLLEKAETDSLAEGAAAAARQIIAGAGLTGGGDLTADRTLNVGAGTGITVNADDVAADPEYIRDTIAAFAVAGTNMTITHNDGANTLTFDASGGGGANETLIQRQDVAGVSTVSFTSIPGSYDALLIYIQLVGGNFTGIRVNNDSNAVYQVQRVGAASGDLRLQSLTQTQWVTGITYANHKMIGNIIDYANTTSSKILNLIGTGAYGTTGGGLGSGSVAHVEYSGLWGPATPAAITRLDFNFASNQTSGFIAIYGRNF